MSSSAGVRLALAGLLASAPLAAQASWRYDQPVRAVRTAYFANRRVNESSGVAVSRTQPGVLWTHNDSGNDPMLYATDTLGHDLGTFRVVGATNNDWEAIRVGACGSGSCLYIGDIGDNAERRGDIVIYRIPEPRVRGDSLGPIATARAVALHVRYPDRPHDAEAMLMTPIGDLLLVTKGIGGVRLYRISLAAWDSDAPATASATGTLPIPADTASFRLVTDGAVAPDGVHAVIRTYRDLYFFRLTADNLVPDSPARACNILGLEVQGEGVDWLDQHHLVLTGEQAFALAGSIAVVTCPSMEQP